MQLTAPIGTGKALDVVAGDHNIGFQILGRIKQIAEFHALIAANTGDRRSTGKIGIGEVIHDGLAEHIFVVQNVMADTELIGHHAGIVDILTGTAGTLLAANGTVIIELQRDPDHVIACTRGQCCGYRAVDTTGHCHNHTGFGGRLAEIEVKICCHGRNMSSKRECRKGQAIRWPQPCPNKTAPGTSHRLTVTSANPVSLLGYTTQLRRVDGEVQ